MSEGPAGQWGLRQQVLRMFRWDLRYQLRDPRTLLLMILTPLVLVPAMTWLSQSADDRREGPLVVAAPIAFAEWVDSDDALIVIDGTLEEPGAPHGAATEPAGQGDDETAGETDDTEPDVTAPLAQVILPVEQGEPYRVRYRGARLEGSAALERVRTVIRRHEEARRADRFARLGLPPPDQILATAVRDASTAEARAGDLLGRLAPLVLLLLVMTGGLHTALDIITGERERGTLETLLSAPVERRAVLYAKGLSVLVTAGVSTVLALISLGISTALFDMGLDGLDASLPPARIAMAGLLMLPLVVMLTAALMLLAARVPDYKAGQFLSAPAMMVVLLPAGLAALPEAELGPLLALIPITGIALAVREVLSGVAEPGLVLLALGAAVAHAGLTVRFAGQALTGERFLLGPPDRRARHARGDFAVEGVGLFLLAILCLWFFGQTAQGLDLTIGMLVTQILTIALPAVAAVAWLGRPIGATLRLRAPRMRDALLAVIAGAAATGVGQLVALVQSPLIPVPEAFLEQFGGQFEGFGLAQALLLFALLPGICEEILFRGALVGLMERRLGRLGVMLAVGAMFGLIHLAVPRILPTGVLGVLLTWAVLRSGSLWIPIIMHAVHNGLLFTLASTGAVAEDQQLPWYALLGASALAIGLVALMGRGSTAAAEKT